MPARKKSGPDLAAAVEGLQAQSNQPTGLSVEQVIEEALAEPGAYGHASAAYYHGAAMRSLLMWHPRQGAGGLETAIGHLRRLQAVQAKADASQKSA